MFSPSVGVLARSIFLHSRILSALVLRMFATSQVVKKSKTVFQNAGGPPIFFVRALVQLEDNINDVRQDKVI